MGTEPRGDDVINLHLSQDESGKELWTAETIVQKGPDLTVDLTPRRVLVQSPDSRTLGATNQSMCAGRTG